MANFRKQRENLICFLKPKGTFPLSLHPAFPQGKEQPAQSTTGMRTQEDFCGSLLLVVLGTAETLRPK